MPLGRKLAIGSEEARRQRAELRISYGNKLSNMNLDRLRKQTQTHPHVEVSPMLSQSQAMGTASLRRIASSFAQVSDVNCGSYAALPLEDCEDDVREELNEVLIRSEPFHLISANKPPAHIPVSVPVAVPVPVAKELPVIHREQRNTCCSDADRLKSRACERWNQIAGTVSSLFRVRRYEHAHPLAELRRLREQRDLLENFTRPFLYENTK